MKGPLSKPDMPANVPCEREREVGTFSVLNRYSHADEGHIYLFSELPYFSFRFAFFKVLAFVLFFPYLTET